MLREFTSGDQASVRELVLEGMRERWGAAYDPAFNSDLDDIVGNYVDHGADVVVIEIEARWSLPECCFRTPTGQGESSAWRSVASAGDKGSGDWWSRNSCDLVLVP